MINELVLEEQRQFRTSFYEWSLEAAKAELRDDFATIRQIALRTVWRLLEYMEHLSLEERNLLVTELVTRSFAVQLPELQNAVGPIEFSRFNEYLSPNVLRPGRLEVQLASRIAAGETKLADRKALGITAKAVLTELHGERPKTWGGGNFSWSQSIGKYEVHTNLDMGARSRQIAYSHHVFVGTSGVRFIEHTSILSWLGVSGMTVWEFVEDNGIEQFGEQFKSIVNRFLFAIPTLLSTNGGSL